MPKVIKFDLPIDGIRAKNIEEIRDHFTLEILAHFRSGLLAKWLAVRKLSEELEALQAIDTSTDDQAVFKRLCEIFAVEADDAVIAVLFNDPMPKFGLTVAEVVKQNETADKIINLADLLPIQPNAVNLFQNRTIFLDSLESLDNKTLILQECEGALIFKNCIIRSSVINGRYHDSGDGTVWDSQTGLRWMRCALGQTWTGATCDGEAKKYDWDAVYSAVKELNTNGGYAGRCDWGLPSIDELKTLVVEDQEPTIDQQAFPNTPSSGFFAGSNSLFFGDDDPHPQSQSQYMNFNDGCATEYVQGNINYVRLVRDEMTMKQMVICYRNNTAILNKIELEMELERYKAFILQFKGNLI
ncbi:DUF1566 domain-containing protein [Chromatium okenii]|nr:DUF1566 domain-containing protein [Chromatium okenii]